MKHPFLLLTTLTTLSACCDPAALILGTDTSPCYDAKIQHSDGSTAYITSPSKITCEARLQDNLDAHGGTVTKSCSLNPTCVGGGSIVNGGDATSTTGVSDAS